MGLVKSRAVQTPIRSSAKILGLVTLAMVLVGVAVYVAVRAVAGIGADVAQGVAGSLGLVPTQVQAEQRDRAVSEIASWSTVADVDDVRIHFMGSDRETLDLPVMTVTVVVRELADHEGLRVTAERLREIAVQLYDDGIELEARIDYGASCLDIPVAGRGVLDERLDMFIGGLEDPDVASVAILHRTSDRIDRINWNLILSAESRTGETAALASRWRAIGERSRAAWRAEGTCHRAAGDSGATVAPGRAHLGAALRCARPNRRPAARSAARRPCAAGGLPCPG